MSKFNKAKLRPMLNEDLPQVLKIEHTRDDLPWLEDTFRNCINANFECIVLEEDNNLIGYSVMALRGKEAHIFNICVIPEKQRKGYGRYMMQYLLAKARDHKAEKVILKVREKRPNAFRLYKQLGFGLVERLVDYYDVPEGKDTALVLEMKLIKNKFRKSS